MSRLPLAVAFEVVLIGTAYFACLVGIVLIDRATIGFLSQLYSSLLQSRRTLYVCFLLAVT